MYRRFRNLRARDLIAGRSCPVVTGAQSVLSAIDAMEAKGENASGVFCDRRFVGIFTRSDFMKKVICRNLNPARTSIFEVMTFDPVVISPWTSLQQAHKTMLEYRVRHLPVLEGRDLKGILSDEDVNQRLLEKYEMMAEEYNSVLSYMHGESYGRCAYSL